jgi:hypothetical protein
MKGWMMFGCGGKTARITVLATCLFVGAVSIAGVTNSTAALRDNSQQPKINFEIPKASRL